MAAPKTRPSFLVRVIIRQSVHILLHALVKVAFATLWYIPAKTYGWWVILSSYILCVEAFAWWLGLVDVWDIWWHLPVWLFAARWRWNWRKYHTGIRPLYERREDL